MLESNIINMKWGLLYIGLCVVFGVSVPEVVAIDIARNVYIEHKDLHGSDEFRISNVETI